MQAFARDGEDALLCAPGSAGELAAGLRRLALDAALRQRLAHAARERVARDHGFARRMQKIVAVYDRLGIAASP
jgi:glycosyltransferase involved in cell wall biosynthesis